MHADRLREECGVFGIFGHPDAAAITALGLHALQHRGQEAAGIVSFDGQRFHSERRLGLVGDTFSRREVIDRLPGIVGRRPCPLFHHRRDASCATSSRCLRRTRPRRFRHRPQRQSDQRPHPAPRAGARRRDHAVHHRYRGDAASGRPLAASRASSIVSSMACRRWKAPIPSSASPTRSWSAPEIRSASGRWCSARSTAARSWPRKPARSTSSARNMCATSRMAKSSSSTTRARIRTSRSRRCAAPLHLRIHLFRPAGLHRRRPRGL